MNRFGKLGILGCAIIMLAAFLPVSAQISTQGGSIRIKADKNQILDKENKVIFIDNVDIIQGDARLRADTVTVQYESQEGAEEDTNSGFGRIEIMHADGKVFYVTPDFKANGDKGVYNFQTGIITLTGNVVILRGNDVATGERLVIYLEEGRTLLEGGENQVNMVFTVEE